MASRRLITSVASAAPQLSKMTAASSPPSVQTRTLSSNGMVAFDRLRDALERYRQQHYTQEIPSRFKKDIVRAAASVEPSGRIASEGLERVLSNIGMHNRVSKEDVQLIFREVGCDDGFIPAERMLKML